MVYCSCSLQPVEGVDRIESLIGTGAPVTRIPVTPDDVGGLADVVSADGDLRSLPCHMDGESGMDGFYAARLKRL